MTVFARAVETGSFRAAAAALDLSPSVVSHHVAKLEKSLDVVLLYRTTRRLTLTEDGARLYEAAREMLVVAETALSKLVRDARNPSGRLCIAAPASLLSGRLADDLAAFAFAFPRVLLTMLFSDAPVSMIDEAIDVAIRAGRLTDSALKSKRIGVLPRRLVASPKYLATRTVPDGPQDLAGWDWIRLKSRPSEATLLCGARKITISFSSRCVVDSGEGMRQMARRGVGIAMLPEALVTADVARGELVVVLPTWRPESPPIYALWPANAPRSGLALRLVSFLQERNR